MTSPDFEGVKEIQSVQLREDEYWYVISGIDGNMIRDSRLRLSTQEALAEQLTSRDRDNALLITSTTPQIMPGWGYVFLRASDPFVLAHNDEVINHIGGFMRMIVRHASKTLYLQIQTDFRPIQTVGDFPFPIYTNEQRF